MSRAALVIAGDVILRATAAGLERAEAIGIADGRVVSAGSRADVVDAALPSATLVDAGPAAVIPGLHDSHLHLVGLARSRRELLLDDAVDSAALTALVLAAAQKLPPGDWLRGRGWHAGPMAAAAAGMAGAVGDRPAFLVAHDGHSAWASSAALRLAGVTAERDDPGGGRIERDAHGAPTGVLRETAISLVARVVPPLPFDETARALDETIAQLHRHGLTGLTDAGDATDAGGSGPLAALGDTVSTIARLASTLDGRVRLTCNIPHPAIAAAAALGLRTGSPLLGARTLRSGWAKLYADGALGSRTAALLAPCADDPAGSTGVLRLERDDILAAAASAIPAGIGLAIHAIGDRAAATVLDAFEAMPSRRDGAPPHRIEHAQLMRATDRQRIAAADLTASMQPIHAVADRDLADAAWSDRLERAYAWRSIAATGARLVFGSDAPVESADPWLGLLAAVQRRSPGDPRGSWTPAERIDVGTALAAYTNGAGAAMGRRDEGHLHPGAHADLAVLNVELPVLLAGDDRLASVRADRTFVAGVEVHRS
jgi:predicted amidohydrolase YtcJ